MEIFVFVASIATAALNAGSSVMERLAASKPKAHQLFSRAFTYEVMRNKMFMTGLGLQLLAAGIQAAALSLGPLVIVEPILTLDLVFLLIFIHMRVGIKVGPREWSAVAAIVLGLSGLFIAAKPGGGHPNYAAVPWLIISSIALIYIFATILVIRRLSSPGLRAAIAGLATAFAYALNAAFTKLSFDQLKSGGVGTLVTHWPLYALIASGLSSLYLMQNAYGAGPLAISQPIMEIAAPTISVFIGILIFGNTMNHSTLASVIEIICLAAILWGVIALSRSKKILWAGEHGL